MKLFKKIAVLLTTTAIIISFASCQNSSQKEIDCPKTAEAVLNDIKFSNELQKADDSIIPMFFELPEDVNAYLYTGNGSSADEFALFDCKTSENLKKTKEAVGIHLAELKESLANYYPEEAARVDDAIIADYGNYLVLCITDDDSAPDVIDKLFK